MENFFKKSHCSLFSFLLHDARAMQPTSVSLKPLGKCSFQIKPLALIWAKLPNYRPENTIMFDDIRRNFLMNPQSGLRVSFRQPSSGFVLAGVPASDTIRQVYRAINWGGIIVTSKQECLVVHPPLLLVWWVWDDQWEEKSCIGVVKGILNRNLQYTSRIQK